MKTQRKVILYGDSLILQGIQVNLKSCPDLEVTPLAAPLLAQKELDALAPDVIIFDLEADHADAVLALQRQRPQLLLVGINLATDQMLIWSGEQSRELAMPNLVQAIHSTSHPGLTAKWGSLSKLPRFWDATIAAHSSQPRRTNLLNRSQPTSRRFMSVMAAGAVILCGALVVTLAQTNPNLPLAGTAIDSQGSLNLVLAFTAGAILGSLALVIWMKRQK